MSNRLTVEYRRQAFEMEQNEDGTATLFFVHSDKVAHRKVDQGQVSLLCDDEDEEDDETYFIFGCDTLVGPFKSVVDAMKHDTFDLDMDEIVEGRRACQMRDTYDFSVFPPDADSASMKEFTA